MKNPKNKYIFLGNSVFIFLNRFFNNIASLLVMFFYAHQLAQVDYGHYQAFWVQLNVFNALAGLGIALFTLTYPPEKMNALLRRIRPKYYLAYLLFLICCGILFSCLQYGNQLNFPWSFLFLIAFALCNVSDALLIGFRKFRFLTVLNFIYAIFFFGIHAVFLYRPFDFNLLLAALLPLLLLKLLLSAWVLWRQSGKLVLNFKLDQHQVTPAMLKLWRHLYLYDILQIASLWLDKFIISLIANSKETAVYVNGTLNIPFLPIIFSAITGSALIHLAKGKERENRLWTVNYVGRLLSCVAFPVCIFFLFFRTDFIVFAFSDKYLASVPIFMCSILIIPFRAYGHTVLLQNLEKGRIINQGAVLDVLLAVMLMYPLYLWIGLKGVALSFVFSTFIQVVFYAYHTKKLLTTSFWSLFPFGNWLWKIVIFTGLVWGEYVFLPERWSGTLKLFVGASIVAVVAAIFLFREFKRKEQVPELLSSGN